MLFKRVQFIKYNLNTMSGEWLKKLLPADIEIMPMPQEVKSYCGMILERIDLLSSQIKEMDTHLRDITLEDPRFKLLLTLPGVMYGTWIDDLLRNRRHRLIRRRQGVRILLSSSAGCISVCHHGKERQGKEAGKSFIEQHSRRILHPELVRVELGDAFDICHKLFLSTS